jgi:hypothetical protein
MDLALTVKERGSDAQQQQATGDTSAARPAKRRCALLGKLKKPGFLCHMPMPIIADTTGQAHIESQSPHHPEPVPDLAAAWNDPDHPFHANARVVVSQLFTYLQLWCLMYGFISCFFGLW